MTRPSQALTRCVHAARRPLPSASPRAIIGGMDDRIVQGQGVEGVGEKAPTRQSYAFMIDEDTPTPLVPMRDLEDPFARLHWRNRVDPFTAGVAAAMATILLFGFVYGLVFMK
jgi:hypothetical protein